MVAVETKPTKDLDVVVRVLTQAFADDPVMVWTQPDRRRHHLLHRALAENVHGVEATFDLAVRDGVVVGASAWEPPGHKTGFRDQLVAMVRMATAIGPGIKRGIALERLFSERRPKEPHWYLAQLGAAAPGLGVGTALLGDRLAQIDGPAYLESSNERNVPLYERFGFQVTDEIVLPFDGPRVWLMNRPMP